MVNLEERATDEHPLLLYDGVCGLCNRTVQFVLPRNQTIRFAPLQSKLAQRLLRRHRLPAGEIDTVVFLDADGAHTYSCAALRVLRHLSGAWPLLAVLHLVPRPIRDACYRFIARRRYRWFGKLDQCQLPTPQQEARFLMDAQPPPQERTEG